MKSGKATHGQLRRENRQLLLRSIYSGLAHSRADLATETGLAKPTVSDLISKLIAEGYLIESGLGQSTEEGGKRPRLLEFVPDARHVIGISISSDQIFGMLCNLEGQVLVEHYKPLDLANGQDLYESLPDVINGLLAQISAPLLCIGVGVPGLVDARGGIVRYAPHLSWQDFPLAQRLNNAYGVPVYIANSPELAAMAQFAFGSVGQVNSMATVLVDDSVGVGSVLDGAIYHSGGEIGLLRLMNGSNISHPLETYLGWPYVRARIATLKHTHPNSILPMPEPTYLDVRQAINEGDNLAMALRDELATYLASIFAWVIALLRPEHLSLAGSIADLGQSLLDSVLIQTRESLPADLMRNMTFSLDSRSNLVALGAVAQTLQQELGLF